MLYATLDDTTPNRVRSVLLGHHLPLVSDHLPIGLLAMWNHPQWRSAGHLPLSSHTRSSHRNVTSRWCNYLTNPKHQHQRYHRHQLNRSFQSFQDGDVIIIIMTMTSITRILPITMIILTCIVAESLTKKTPPSLSPIRRSVASCRDIAPKYQLKVKVVRNIQREGLSATNY